MLDLKKQLQDLNELDQSFQIFGASTHKYRSNPIEPENIHRFEQELGIELPGEYRIFLEQLGWGAGPYYGIWSLEETQEGITSLIHEYQKEEGIAINLQEPFPYSKGDMQICREKIKSGDEEPWITGAWPSGGCLPICHHGCTFWSVLVVCGELTGRVLDVANYEGFVGLWLPAQRAPGIVSTEFLPEELSPLLSPPTFVEWYQGWIVRSMSDLQTLNVKPG